MMKVLMSRGGFLLGVWAGVALLGCKPGGEPGGAAGGAKEPDYGTLSRQAGKLFGAGKIREAIPLFEAASAMEPQAAQAHVNLANAYLRDDRAEDALKAAAAASGLDTNLAAAVYLQGCASLRLGRVQEAIELLERAKAYDATINPVSYQLARAYQDAGLWEPAVTNLEEVVLFDPNHKAAHFNLGQAYLRLGRREEGESALAEHRRVVEGVVNPPGLEDFERCRYTRIVVPFELQQPLVEGVRVEFVDATPAVLGDGVAGCVGPLAVLDLRRDGFHSLFVREGGGAFRLLLNSNGVFSPQTLPVVVEPGAVYSRALAGDLNNDQVQDLVLLGEGASHILQFSTNGLVRDQTRFSRFTGVTGRDGLLADLDYTGKLDLLVLGGTNSFQVLRNLGHPYFVDNTTNFTLSGISKPVGLMVEDWNEDDLLDVIVSEEGGIPVLLARQRDGRFAYTNAFAGLPAGELLGIGDLDNDLKPDLVLLAGDELVCVGSAGRRVAGLSGWRPGRLELLDLDNDGWLDLVGYGEGLRVWRNLGVMGFKSWDLGLGRVEGRVTDLVAADFDRDCDTDLVVSLEGGGVRMLRNEGGNSNRQLQLDLLGTRSNASGLGIRLEVTAEGLQLQRRIARLPVEIGVGNNTEIDAVSVQWFDFTQNTIDVEAKGCSLLRMQELQKQTGSCPYLYAWDGTRFRFVTDLLGGSPLGLPLSGDRLIESDPDELVWIGDESLFLPREGSFVVQVTEELREVLYLDAAELWVVDHPAGTEVHTTGKLTPGKPFPKSEIVTLHRAVDLKGAWDDSGREVTSLVARADGRYLSPLRSQLRVAQLRGLAEPHAVTLDFGPLAVERPLVLAISAWLRFGGASVNIGASHDPDLPPPFPVLEVETGDGAWRKVDVEVGAPAGKPKNFVVDLTGHLPAGSRRLRLTTAFEIHWDRIALLERRDNAETRIHRLKPSTTDLHWRGFSRDLDLPWYEPITPDYEVVDPLPLWRTSPSGYCTRYGEVDELLAGRDNALVIVSGGDELTLTFAASGELRKGAGEQRDFFFYSSGWDKDSDVHCVRGWEVEPLPWHGMNDQLYGREVRPRFANDDWIRKYNTRHVGARWVTRRE